MSVSLLSYFAKDLLELFHVLKDQWDNDGGFGLWICGGGEAWGEHDSFDKQFLFLLFKF